MLCKRNRKRTSFTAQRICGFIYFFVEKQTPTKYLKNLHQFFCFRSHEKALNLDFQKLLLDILYLFCLFFYHSSMCFVFCKKRGESKHNKVLHIETNNFFSQFSFLKDFPQIFPSISHVRKWHVLWKLQLWRTKSSKKGYSKL